jgi:hypothetical protein
VCRGYFPPQLQRYLFRGEDDPFFDVNETRDDMLRAELQVDASMNEPEICFRSQSAPPMETLMQALKLIPSAQSAVRFYRQLEQVIQFLSPVQNRRERMSQTSAPCSSIAF